MIVLWIMFLFSSPATDHWPALPTYAWLDRLPLSVKHALQADIARCGLTYPDLECVDYDNFFGPAVLVYYRRWIGRPAAWPHDPVLGPGKPPGN